MDKNELNHIVELAKASFEARQREKEAHDAYVKALTDAYIKQAIQIAESVPDNRFELAVVEKLNTIFRRDPVNSDDMHLIEELNKMFEASDIHPIHFNQEQNASVTQKTPPETGKSKPFTEPPAAPRVTTPEKQATGREQVSVTEYSSVTKSPLTTSTVEPEKPKPSESTRPESPSKIFITEAPKENKKI